MSLIYREEGRGRPFTIMQKSDTQQTQSRAPDRFEASLQDWCEKMGEEWGFGNKIGGEIEGHDIEGHDTDRRKCALSKAGCSVLPGLGQNDPSRV